MANPQSAAPGAAQLSAGKATPLQAKRTRPRPADLRSPTPHRKQAARTPAIAPPTIDRLRRRKQKPRRDETPRSVPTKPAPHVSFVGNVREAEPPKVSKRAQRRALHARRDALKRKLANLELPKFFLDPRKVSRSHQRSIQSSTLCAQPKLRDQTRPTRGRHRHALQRHVPRLLPKASHAMEIY